MLVKRTHMLHIEVIHNFFPNSAQKIRLIANPPNCKRQLPAHSYTIVTAGTTLIYSKWRDSAWISIKWGGATSKSQPHTD